jgi:predicted AAA+ superfamily ATPase
MAPIGEQGDERVDRAPYVVGQWVRGEKFYGRVALIAEILHGPRNAIWLLGYRRIGKTSLLRQIEHLTSDAEQGAR